MLGLHVCSVVASRCSHAPRLTWELLGATCELGPHGAEAQAHVQPVAHAPQEEVVLCLVRVWLPCTTQAASCQSHSKAIPVSHQACT